MKKFSDIYEEIKPAIVAVASKFSLNPEFLDIIGTGFIIRSDGVILTNNHVIQGIKKLPRLKNMKDTDWPIVVLFFHFVPEKGMMTIPLEVKGVGTLRREKPIEGYHYGTELPDLGFIKVDIKDLPTLKIAKKLELKEGDEVVLAGFPMGTDTLRAPGWVHQLTPTLQAGIISAILPFSCENPHAILLDIMTQGGSSGSPILNPLNGEVVGIEYAGIIEPKELKIDSRKFIYENNTSLTLAIPAKVLHEVSEIAFKEEFNNTDITSFDSIETLISKKKTKLHLPKTSTLRPVASDEFL